MPALEIRPTIVEKDGTVTVDTLLGMDSPIFGIAIDKTGKFNLTGKIDIETGSASVVMWTRIEGKLYFSKVADYQNMKIEKDKAFSIPFDAGDKKADYVVIAISTPGAGRFVIKELKVK
jgi:hypothetical protein